MKMVAKDTAEHREAAEIFEDMAQRLLMVAPHRLAAADWKVVQAAFVVVEVKGKLVLASLVQVRKKDGPFMANVSSQNDLEEWNREWAHRTNEWIDLILDGVAKGPGVSLKVEEQ